MKHAIEAIFINIYRIFRVLVELAQLQDEEVGDGTTSVVIIAAELLKVWMMKLNLQFVPRKM